MGYTSCLADPDVWFRASTKPDGFEYYEYILVYIDDLVVISHQPSFSMKLLEEVYRLKDGYSEPDRYLGAEVKQWHFPEDSSKKYWVLSSHQYIKEMIRNVELHLQEQNCSLPKVHQPLPSHYFWNWI